MKNLHRLAPAIVLGMLLGLIVILTLLDDRADAQPYGGCKEAWIAPHSDGADWCRDHGWTVRSFIVVGPHRWVRYYDLPSCKYEDASSGPIPCRWNFDDGDGNGEGKAYYVTGTHRHPHFHYVKGVKS